MSKQMLLKLPSLRLGINPVKQSENLIPQVSPQPPHQM